MFGRMKAKNKVKNDISVTDRLTLNSSNFEYDLYQREVLTKVDVKEPMNEFKYDIGGMKIPLGNLIHQLMGIASICAVGEYIRRYTVNAIYYNRMSNTFYFVNDVSGTSIELAMRNENQNVSTDAATIKANNLINKYIFGYEANICRKVSVNNSKERVNDILLFQYLGY